jgi:glucosylglycerate phosphorylase
MKHQSLNQQYFHHLDPDYTKPLFKIPVDIELRLMEKLHFLYGETLGGEAYDEILRTMQVYYAHKSDEMLKWEKKRTPEERFTQEDVILITYGDLVRAENEEPLDTLAELCQKYLEGVVNTLHLLPFFPYSSDRGFSIMDFEEVDPHLGTWENITSLKKEFKLMFDGVINHVSAKSRWFQEFLNQKPYYKDFFTVFSTKEKISPDHLHMIVRPRTSNVFTEFRTIYGPQLVWTTFSPDQIDLNYKNPNVLIKMLEILLLYVRRGADLIRLDAVTYLWDELGTSSVHLAQTHVCIKLFRDILDAVAPHVALITETNVPHEENISYFGNGKDEAQMVYNFALPPLVLYTFQTGNAQALTKWAASLKKVSYTASYFNFLDSHDGIGVMAVKNILSKDEIEQIALKVIEHGGYISYKDNGDGTESPYELNITWYSAINREDDEESQDLKIKRYIASRAIAFVLMGVPGIYLHGFLGSKNDAEAVIEEGHTRSINRKSISKKDLISALNDSSSNIYKISSRLVSLIQIRREEKAFHPNADQQVLDLSNDIFAVRRTSLDRSESILAIINITQNDTMAMINKSDLGTKRDQINFTDLITKKHFHFENNHISIRLGPYKILWLKYDAK